MKVGRLFCEESHKGIVFTWADLRCRVRLGASKICINTACLVSHYLKVSNSEWRRCIIVTERWGFEQKAVGYVAASRQVFVTWRSTEAPVAERREFQTHFKRLFGIQNVLRFLWNDLNRFIFLNSCQQSNRKQIRDVIRISVRPVVTHLSMFIIAGRVI